MPDCSASAFCCLLFSGRSTAVAASVLCLGAVPATIACADSFLGVSSPSVVRAGSGAAAVQGLRLVGGAALGARPNRNAGRDLCDLQAAEAAQLLHRLHRRLHWVCLWQRVACASICTCPWSRVEVGTEAAWTRPDILTQRDIRDLHAHVTPKLVLLCYRAVVARCCWRCCRPVFFLTRITSFLFLRKGG